MGDVVGDLGARFAGRRVLVTGDTGFKGSWLCSQLLSLGAEVHGFALPPESPDDHFSVLGLASSMHHRDGDIRDLDQLERIFRECRPEFVFHLAAQSLVRRSQEDPKTTFDTNVGGFVNVLECLRKSSNVRAAVLITSDKCYRNKEWVWGYRENDELGGRDPYSASKAAAEIAYASYQDSFFRHRGDLGVATTRAGNVIGGGDWARDRIVPDCVRALRAGKPIVLRNPTATRPWQHVLEPLSGYLALGVALSEEPARYSGAWNFGPRGDAVRTVEDLARGVVRHFGRGEVRVEPDDHPVHESRLLHLNCDRAAFELGWRPRWSFEETVAQTAAWYRDALGGARAADLTRAQIEAYAAR